MEQHDDLYYIRKIREGEVDYFSVLVDRYKDVVFSVALKVLKNREDAEELAQDTFVKVYKSLHTFKGSSKFSTWIYSVTYNNCITKLRKKKYEVHSIEDIQIKDESVESAQEEIIKEEQAQYLEKALKMLPHDDYTLIILYYYKDQSIEEISLITKLSESNTKVKLFRARKKLQKIMNKMTNHKNIQHYEKV